MRAVLYEQFQQFPEIRDVPVPRCPPNGAVVAVRATGVCRSDWHGWMGHDPGIALPHVPGHEFAGVVAEVGAEVERWKAGDRVTTPFVSGCGSCEMCLAGEHNVCPNQTQPGFTHWGSFAEQVVVDWADTNLVGLPDEVGFATAAGLGCRFATSYRAVVHHGGAAQGRWLALYGCGGVGLAAVMVAVSRAMRVVAVDISPDALALAASFGAEVTLDGRDPQVVARVREITGGGAHLSIDALGRSSTLADAVASLRPRGRHVQIGLLLAEDASPAVDMGTVVARELEIVGSHGMSAHHYPELLGEVASGRLQPGLLVTRTISLEQAPAALAALGTAPGAGTTVVVLD